MDKTSLIELSNRKSRATCVVLDVVTRKSHRSAGDFLVTTFKSYLRCIGCGHEEVSSRSMYIGSKDETFNELEPKPMMVSAVPVTVGVTVETWLSGFLFTEDYSEEQALKGISQ